MTRDEIRAMGMFINTERPAWMHVDVPDPEPAYWDNFPHLLRDDITRYTHGMWALLLKGKYEPHPCGGCQQVVWEYEYVYQFAIYLLGLEYHADGDYFCLPCCLALDASEGVIVDYAWHYEGTLLWSTEGIVPSEGVFTNEYWYGKAKLNYSAEDVHAIKTGTLTAQDIIERRVRQWSEH
jgi:hypothetical protein